MVEARGDLRDTRHVGVRERAVGTQCTELAAVVCSAREHALAIPYPRKVAACRYVLHRALDAARVPARSVWHSAELPSGVLAGGQDVVLASDEGVRYRGRYRVSLDPCAPQDPLPARSSGPLPRVPYAGRPCTLHRRPR